MVANRFFGLSTGPEPLASSRGRVEVQTQDGATDVLWSRPVQTPKGQENSKKMRMRGKCEEPKVDGEGNSTSSGKMGKYAPGRAGQGKKSGSAWRGVGVVQDVLRACWVPSWADIAEPL